MKQPLKERNAQLEKELASKNRELEIEAALECVRARTMSMQKSAELLNVIQLVSEQLLSLNFNISAATFALNYKESDDFDLWMAVPGQSYPTKVHIPYFDHPMFSSFIESKVNGCDFLVQHFTFEEKNKWFNHFFENMPGAPQDEKNFVYCSTGYASSNVLMEAISMGIANLDAIPYSEVQNAVLRRFANVFGQAYTRFFDLQKAEAQAREAQIEMALEKVRSRTMAMFKSEELADAAATVFHQLQTLGIRNLRRNLVGIMNEEEAVWDVWYTTVQGESFAKFLKMPVDGHPIASKMKMQWLRKEKIQVELSGDNLKNWLKFILDSGWQYPIGERPPDKFIIYGLPFSNGYLVAFTDDDITPEEIDLLQRFAHVFEQPYTRFLDLQKAEAQAREATIETALERVRGKAMAMHTSRDLAETIKVFYQEIELLSESPRRCGVGLMTRKTRIVELSTMNTTDEGNSIEVIGKLNLVGHPVLDGIYDNWLQQKEYHPVLRGNEIKEYYKLLRPQITFPDYPHDAVQFGYFFYFAEGGVYAWTNNELEEDELKIYRRFTTVLSLTYKRYKDLTDAEARAKEAIKQASLDRVRGEIASMRSTEDLQRITPLIFKELTALNVPFFRCGVFIIDETENRVHAYLSTPDGHSLGVLNLIFDSNDLTANTVRYWRKGLVYHQHWNKEEFINWTQSMKEQGQIQKRETYQHAAAPPEALDLHFVPFAQGMLYVGNSIQLNKEEIALVKSLAEAFSIAYARYEDFTKLEHAKQSIENTLTELKATQKQLIQSEKMASLGELTAGIAHEIQNPLNFVNNFSEVNTELIGELEQEADKGNIDEVKILAKDIKENSEKINHHGKRAGDIVKGMLQHSRSSTGVKEPTDINALADEYLRLSYHGLRAKDKSFNATMKTDFDESIGKINVIPQDIGRVLLNLYNNAFYACTERLGLSKAEVNQSTVNQQKSENLISHEAADEAGVPTFQRLAILYEPTVSVSTKKIGDKIEIKVSDNGNGIPQKIVDKIFQPFFTTKPTGQGTGLGLSLSYDIMKAHGGEIKVESKEGEGSTFVIQLPVV